MNRIKTCCATLLLLCICGWLVPDAAAVDDFGAIVHQIETQYHVHRNYRFLMAFTGVAVKLTSFTGVKGFKAAIFENQHLFQSQPDDQLDEVMQSAGKSGWQPLVRSFSRRTGEHNYIYIKGASKDLKVLVVSVEPGETVVAQVKINADKLSGFINEHTRESTH
jgi:hypothetical protein